MARMTSWSSHGEVFSFSDAREVEREINTVRGLFVFRS